jgi:hypothetical protein
MARLGTHRNLQHARPPREEGVVYCGDWNSDDQPFRMKVKTGRMYAVPYCMEINDIPLFIRKGYTGEQYLQSLVDQFDALYADSAKQPRVMGIPLHPMITGQPLRIKYLERALAHMKQRRQGLVCDRQRDRRRLPARDAVVSAVVFPIVCAE